MKKAKGKIMAIGAKEDLKVVLAKKVQK